MKRSTRAITLLAVWLAVFFAGPILPAFAVPCAAAGAAYASPPACPMKHSAVNGNAEMSPAACCCTPDGTPKQGALRRSSSGGPIFEFSDQNHCACSVQQGVPMVPSDTPQAPLPGLILAFSKAPIIATIPPLAHLAADAPLPPFAARLRLPHHALDTGRAPPAA